MQGQAVCINEISHFSLQILLLPSAL